jgi:GNAT superfamily N-acetyltransferase
VAQVAVVDPPLLPIEDGGVLVAVLGEDIVGFAVVLSRDNGDAELDGLFVEPDHWRKGIGARLVRAAERLAVESGVAALHLSANPNARAFYIACGFSELGEVPTQFGVGVVMSKALAEGPIEAPDP